MGKLWGSYGEVVGKLRGGGEFWGSYGHGGRSWSGPDPKGGVGGALRTQNCYTEQYCALSAPGAPEILF